MKRTIIVALGCAAVLLAPATTLAGRNDSVDPAIMQPALNPAFAPWDCWRSGAGITCEGQLRNAWTNGEWGLVCDGRPVYTTGTEERDAARHGDDQGRALFTHTHVAISETLSLQPDGSGPTLRAGGTWEQHFDYATPGDITTKTERDTGLNIRVSGPGVGTVLMNAGYESWDFEGDYGPHHGNLLPDFDAAFLRVCDAFEALGA